MVNVTGFLLKETLKTKSLELATVQTNFEESLQIFEGEEKKTPVEIAAHIAKLEGEISQLQTMQSVYNLKVMVTSKDSEGKDKQTTLEMAIKAVGGMGRMAKRWREVAKGKQRERYGRDEMNTRKTDEVYAKPTIRKDEALVHAIAAEKAAASIRTAIAKGNLTEIEFGDTFDIPLKSLYVAELFK